MLQKLEKYELLEEIGHGGMATVYRARDEHLDRFVALKLMHPHLRTAKEARIRFAREARSVARLRHPNILEIYDYSGEESEESYIAAELLTGPTLKEYARDRAEIPAEVAACFAVELARALEAAHKNGIVHRDVKPENVLLHERRCIKLTDFGIAQMVDAQGFTATGQILGSPGHMAPEQIEGKDCDERTDLFSLGTVLYFLAVGQLPFTGRNPHAILRRIMEAEFTDPLRARPSIGEPLARIIRKAMSREAENRYQTAEEFEADLVDFLTGAEIDDPRAFLEKYLRDPDATATSLRERLIPLLTTRGQEAVRKKEIAVAFCHFNRALALDEGNPKVLALIRRLGRRQTQRRVLLLSAGTLLAVGGLSGIVYAISLAVDPLIAPDAGVAGDGPLDAETAPSSDAAVTAIADRDAAVETDGSALVPADAGDATGELRTVVFQPHPHNVSISVDGSPPRAFGPSFRQMRLEPGTHRIRMTPGSDCCEDVDFRINVPPGDTSFVVSRNLPPKPAHLYVTANVLGDVVVDNGVARGRTQSLIRVPLESIEQVRRFTVTAPGYRAYSGVVSLRANEDATVPVTLEVGASPGER